MAQQSSQLAEHSANLFLQENEDTHPLDTIQFDVPGKVIYNGQFEEPAKYKGAEGKLREEILHNNSDSESLVQSKIADSNSPEKSEQGSMRPDVELFPTTLPFGEDDECQRLSPFPKWTNEILGTLVDLPDVPEIVQLAMEIHVGDDTSFNDLINTRKHLLTEALIQRGTFTADSSAAKQFMHTLDTIDNQTLGDLLASKILGRSRNTYRLTVGSETPGSGQVTGESSSNNNAHEMEVDGSALTSPQTSTSENSKPRIKVQKEATWQRAHDAIRKDKPRVDQAFEVSKFIFDDILTRDEILDCSLRSQFIGREEKRRKTEAFPHEKLLFIRDACAFILNTSKRTDVGTVQFEQARAKEDFASLDDQTWKELRTPLLSKYASTRRKDLESSP